VPRFVRNPAYRTKPSSSRMAELPCSRLNQSPPAAVQSRFLAEITASTYSWRALSQVVTSEKRCHADINTQSTYTSSLVPRSLMLESPSGIPYCRAYCKISVLSLGRLYITHRTRPYLYDTLDMVSDESVMRMIPAERDVHDITKLVRILIHMVVIVQILEMP